MAVREAVVLGGSVAGLMAARVLSGHAQGVTVVEPDDPGGSGARPGAPQGRQLHVLLGMGQAHLERWLPGLVDELLADGAVLAEGERVQHYLDGVRKVPVPGHDLVGLTRPFLEAHIRRRVLARENVRLVRGRAAGLTADGRRVTGAEYHPVDGDGAAEADRVHLPADLVVDATGRASRLGTWLAELGWRPPSVERMRIDLGYASAFFRRGGELPGVPLALALASQTAPGAEQRDSGAVCEVEGGRWLAVLAAYADRRPTRDPEDFRARLGRIPAQPIREVAAGCELLGEISTHRLPDSRRRDFWGLDRFPAGLVAAGDAVASFNPVYGQGMTSAVLHATCLAGWLEGGGAVAEPAREYFRRLRAVVDAAWAVSTLGDLALPHVAGPYPRGYRAALWYTDKLNRATVTDPEVHRRFLDVANMISHPARLSRPGTGLLVARALLTRRQS